MPMPGIPPSPSHHDSTPPLPRIFYLGDGRESSIWSGLSPLPFVFGLRNIPRRTRLLSEDFKRTLARWTCRHWNRRLLSLADNPDFGLFGLPRWCSGFPSLLLFLLSISEMIPRYADRRVIVDFPICTKAYSSSPWSVHAYALLSHTVPNMYKHMVCAQEYFSIYRVVDTWCILYSWYQLGFRPLNRFSFLESEFITRSKGPCPLL